MKNYFKRVKFVSGFVVDKVIREKKQNRSLILQIINIRLSSSTKNRVSVLLEHLRRESNKYWSPGGVESILGCEDLL